MQGAEATIKKLDDTIIKQRMPKTYRIPEIDERLRKFRTRREAKVLQKLEHLQFPAPHVRDWSDKRMEIVMDLLEGPTLQQKGVINHAEEIGQRIAELHNTNIIHGDLTPANMLWHKESVHLIDFGLSLFSEKIEDKAVDLHLFERSLHTSFPMKDILTSYKQHAQESDKIMKRLEQVRTRGRNKKKN